MNKHTSFFTALCWFATFVVAWAELDNESEPKLITPQSISHLQFLSQLMHAPEMQATEHRLYAAHARIDSSAQFPDPQIASMISNVALPSGRENLMWEVGIQQPLPQAGARSADRARAEARLDLADLQRAALLGKLATFTTQKLVEIQATEARISLLKDQQERTRQLLDSLDAQVATANAGIAARLSLQSRIDALELELAHNAQAGEDALSAVQNRLALQSIDSLREPVNSPLDSVRPEESPSYQIALKRSSEANARMRMARADAHPRSAIGFRFSREQEAMGNKDTVGIAFSTDLPWRAQGYAKAETRAARAEVHAYESDAQAENDSIQTLLARVKRAEAFAVTTERLTQSTLKRLESEYQALLTALSTGDANNENRVVSLLMLLDVLDRKTDMHMQAINARALADQAHAELWTHAPIELFKATFQQFASIKTE